MTERTVNFIRSKKIDSYLKLHLLLFLHQYPTFIGTSDEIARCLYLGDVPLMDRTIQELSDAGLLECVEQRCRLSDDPSLHTLLQHLNHTYSDPLARQTLLKAVRPHSHYAPI